MSLEDFIISVFCLVDDNFVLLVEEKNLRQRGFVPKLTDSEVITMEIVGEFLGFDTDKGIWSYFKRHWLSYFPNIGSRSNFAKQASNLWKIKQQLQTGIAEKLQATTDHLHMVDGFPVPVCHFKRAHFSRIFKGNAAYGYCASKDEKYYGFKGNVLINSYGVITNFTMTAANVDEREALWEMTTNNIQGLLLADKGLIGSDFRKQLLVETGINIQTPLRNNMKDPRGKDASSWIISTRRLVETVIGQLTEHFHIQKVRARDLWHLTNRVSRKILSHTVAVFINKSLGNEPLQLENLLTI